ncbi:TetR-like C-terminal domain-containing protein [Oceanobacillus halotolerans]|uniref:TetR-like C-terminal domain-containing protein n=1 Tax=Oceanobacillus halotolerans TaxID=2663380 RepID=UPI0013DBA535|nr:TetR-like C-terminal domain-containing protein [Oceanobacillus halotolerans]
MELLARQNEAINEDMLVIYRAYGLVGLILEWIKSDFAASPRYMAHQAINILNYQPLEKYLIR